MSSLSSSSTGIENSSSSVAANPAENFSNVPELTCSLPIEEFVEYSEEYIRQIATFIKLNAAQLFRQHVYDSHIERRAGKYILPGDCVIAVDKLMRYLYGNAYVPHDDAFIKSISGWYPAYSYGMRAKTVSEKLGIDHREHVRPRSVNVVYEVNWQEGRLTRRRVDNNLISSKDMRLDPDAILSTCLTRCPPPPPEIALKRAVVATFTVEAATVISNARKNAYIARVRSIFDSVLRESSHVLHRFSASTRRATGNNLKCAHIGSSSTTMQYAPIPRTGVPDFSEIHVHFCDQQTESFFDMNVRVPPSQSSPRRRLSSRPPRAGVPTNFPYLSLANVTNSRLIWTYHIEDEDTIDWEPHRAALGIALGRIRGLITETPVSGLTLCQYIDWEYRERGRRFIVARPSPDSDGYIFGDCRNFPVDNDSIALLVRYNFCELYDLGRVPIGHPEGGVSVQRLVTRRTRTPVHPTEDQDDLWDIFEDLISKETEHFEPSIQIDEAAMGLTSLRYELELGRTWSLFVQIARQNNPLGAPPIGFDPSPFLKAGMCALEDVSISECYAKDVAAIDAAINTTLAQAWGTSLSWIDDPHFSINSEWDIVWTRISVVDQSCTVIRQEDTQKKPVSPGETVVIVYEHDDFCWLANTVARVCGVYTDTGLLIGEHTRAETCDSVYAGWIAGRNHHNELPQRVIVCGPCPTDIRRWLTCTGCRIVTVDPSLHEAALSLHSFRSNEDLRLAWKDSNKTNKIVKTRRERHVFLYGNDVIAKLHVFQRKLNVNDGRLLPGAVHVSQWANAVSWFQEAVICSFSSSWPSTPGDCFDPSYAKPDAWLWKFACQCVHHGGHDHTAVNTVWTNAMQWDPVRGAFSTSPIPIHVSIGLKIRLPDPRMEKRPYQMGNGRARLGVIYRIRLVCPAPESVARLSPRRLHTELQRPGSPSRDLFSVFRPRSYQLPDPANPGKWKRSFTVDGILYDTYQLTSVPEGAVAAFEQLLEKTTWTSDICGYIVSVVRADGRAYETRLTVDIDSAESVSIELAKDSFVREQLCSRMYACCVALVPPPGLPSEAREIGPLLTTLEDVAWLPLQTTTERVCVLARPEPTLNNMRE